MRYKNTKAGISLIEVLLVTSLMTVFFVGILGAFRGIFILVSDTSSRQTAITIASDVMEEIRSLEYNSVGTIAGIPSGPVPQISTTTRNEVDFVVSTLIEYVDDPADGLGTLDGNGITTDYKRAEVAIEWSVRGNNRRMTFNSNFMPPGVESTVGGGTLRVNVFDATLSPVTNATVRLRNDTVTPNIDTIRTTNASGTALFSGAPTASNYEIEVSKTDYSFDQTHIVDEPLTNPLMPPVTIVENNITSASFFIDQTSTLEIKTLSNQIFNSISPVTTDDSSALSYSNVSFSPSGVELEELSGVYSLAGTVQFSGLSPATILEWQSVDIASLLPSGTAFIARIYDGNNPGVLLPNAALPGNDVGFSQATIDISSVDPLLYPSLSVGFELETLNNTVTPVIENVTMTYIESETPIAGVSLDILGNKIIGTDTDGGDIVKNQTTAITNSLGDVVITDLEWDLYNILPVGYAIAEACPSAPATIDPNTNNSLRLTLESGVASSLRVHVIDASGVSIPNATVSVVRPSYNEVAVTGGCGQAFFNTASIATNYEVTVDATGYMTEVVTGVSVNANDLLVVQLTSV